ncbi:glycogen debranching protein GlgX [Kitasatospora sp. NPDC051853]|uniref:glycogen debranching protein GlgX n=1 Tax=Kitasatospora sp. NPDC051853 TaxID=3364058 RepID=UPI0037A22793
MDTDDRGTVAAEEFATDRIAGYDVRPGTPYPFGATYVPGGVNFSVYSSRADDVSLVLFKPGDSVPVAEIPIPDEFRVGGVWAITVLRIGEGDVDYGYRVFGPPQPAPGDRFDPAAVLLDPYAKAVTGRDTWGEEPDWNSPNQYRARLTADHFDWQGDHPLRLPAKDLVVYELHVRGFTRHESAGVAAPGTFAGLREKIPYLKELGVNCVELMPVFEFDEFENSRTSPTTGDLLLNYWGYSTVGFFAPKAGYAAGGAAGRQREEFKELVRDLHANGIQVILDVVFNHTAEGNEHGPTIHFRGLDNSTYYQLTPEGYYQNFSGTGNTFNCNNPVVRDYILSCLRYWASEYHVDGFRFDLASILDRGEDGAPLENPPLLEALSYDPLLKDCVLIAEAWDAGGLYQVGAFPNYGRWAEWNGKYRDVLRRFLKGEPGTVGELATRLVGSPDLYGTRGTTASVNFVTCHDGFTLNDLFSYNERHNEANGEYNRDGNSDNDSWNSGAEGPTDDPEVLALRRRQAKNAMVLLLTSQGIPMILAGDEFGNTQGGNNNAYCQDSEISWLTWPKTDEADELRRFTTQLIRFRQEHEVLRRATHPTGADAVPGYPDVSWHGTRAWQPDWSEGDRVLAVMRCGEHEDGSADFVYVAANAHWEGLELELPDLPGDMRWHRAADTSAEEPEDISAPGAEPVLEDQLRYPIGPRSAVVLVGRRNDG